MKSIDEQRLVEVNETPADLPSPLLSESEVQKQEAISEVKRRKQNENTIIENQNI